MKYKRKQNPSSDEKFKRGKVKIKWKQLLTALLSFAAALAIYETFMYFEIAAIIHIYAVILAACGITFGILNRGFSQTPVAYEQLPCDWDEEKKQKYLSDDLRRRKIGKSFLYPAFAILLTFSFDFIYITYIQK